MADAERVGVGRRVVGGRAHRARRRAAPAHRARHRHLAVARARTVSHVFIYIMYMRRGY